ncbi:hypothetical protein HMN09_01367300 [Mycena chlorophos]|uniref:Uncharacterized protein n=1 Tax=Mycena chlorophos TaxID=658473 RepID=A0A8H6S061_MYCCL|nr:hypothetical protein HMN09_01367300 [Mycena chlorophos]
MPSESIFTGELDIVQVQGTLYANRRAHLLPVDLTCSLPFAPATGVNLGLFQAGFKKDKDGQQISIGLAPHLDLLNKFTAELVAKVEKNKSLLNAKEWRGELSFDGYDVKLKAEVVTTWQSARDSWDKIHWAPRFLMVFGAKTAVRATCGPVAGTLWLAWDVAQITNGAMDAAISMIRGPFQGFWANISAEKIASQRCQWLVKIVSSPSISMDIWKLKSATSGCELTLSVVLVGTLRIEFKLDDDRNVVNRTRDHKVLFEGDIKISLKVEGLENAFLEMLMDVVKGNRTARGSGSVPSLLREVEEYGSERSEPKFDTSDPDFDFDADFDAPAPGPATYTSGVTAYSTTKVAKTTMHTAANRLGADLAAYKASDAILNKVVERSTEEVFHHVREKAMEKSMEKVFQRVGEKTTEKLLEQVFTPDLLAHAALRGMM